MLGLLVPLTFCLQADGTLPMHSAFTRPPGKPVKTVQIQAGDLSAVFRDNSESPGILSGISSLRNTREAPAFDAFDPDARGASAGLNFEHIISGHENPNNAFTPRRGPYALYHTKDDPDSVVLVRDASHSPWAVGSTMTYTLSAPHYIDFEFRCRAYQPALLGQRGYALFFWANYMNDVLDESIHFRGLTRPDDTPHWIADNASTPHQDWNTGGTFRSIQAPDLTYDDDVRFRLNHWSYEWPRFTKPFYYGRSAHGMVYILMFDRTYSAIDEIRFSLFKFKLPKRPRPAWDFQYVIHRVQPEKEYGFRGRAVWKKFVSPEDCEREYEQWAASLKASSQPAR